MPTITLTIAGDTPESVQLTGLLDLTTNAAPPGVSLPAEFTSGSGGSWVVSFTGPAHVYSYTFVRNWSDDTSSPGSGTLDASFSGDAGQGVGAGNSLTEVQAAYDTNASYMEDGSAAKARAFITACRILIRRMPLEHGTRESHTRTSVEFLQRELTQAIQWLAANGGAGTAGAVAGVSRFDFTNFRS